MEHRSPAVLRDEDLACLAGLIRLREFQVAEPVDKPLAFTNRGLAYLHNLVNMERLTLGGPQLTDEGLAHLSAMTRLHMLNIDAGRFTDRGLQTLAQFGRLRALRLIGAHRFSPAALRRLFENLPNLGFAQIGPKWPDQRLTRARVLANCECTIDVVEIASASRARVLADTCGRHRPR